MLSSLASRLFGTTSQRTLRRSKGLLEAVNAAEASVQILSDADLAAVTPALRARLSRGEALDSLLPEAFAAVREASRRTLGMRHFDVQILGGIALHQGRIAEMRTGEGKTLVATLPAYLNALPGNGVHIVTVNDYLAGRDAEEMGRIFSFLGMTVGAIRDGFDDNSRRAVYARDVSYVTNHELGFDYLRDNMRFDRASMVLRPLSYAIVDEIDSILIDEARTPLIISGPSDDDASLCPAIDAVVRSLPKGSWEKDEKQRTAALTDEGIERVEQSLRNLLLMPQGGLFDPGNLHLIHRVDQAVRAHALYRLDVDYILRRGKIVIVDPFTGRAMDSRRWSDGLHQAIEAKEAAEIQVENQTLASITYQNLFRLYPKLSGMTGTAMTEADEFAETYGIEVVAVPTNRPVIRRDEDDEVYRTEREKFSAVADLIGTLRAKDQPILVGTASIESSERLSAVLDERGVPHRVLNARWHEQEAHIVAQAGRPGSVTIATNMAGRGTDIQLGGNLAMRLRDELAGLEDGSDRDILEAGIRASHEEERARALASGGLFVIGTERHESRRIDNQLRGRSGRQGDPGASRFFLSLEDELLKTFGLDRMDGMLQKLGMEEGEPLSHRWITKAVERAQAKVEARNLDSRRNVLRYDDVLDHQRKAVYSQRLEIMGSEILDEEVSAMCEDVLDALILRCVPERSWAEEWDLDGLHEECLRIFGLDLPLREWAAAEGVGPAEMRARIDAAAQERMSAKRLALGAWEWNSACRSVLLGVYDQCWREHLHALDHLRQGIGLRAYGQRDPLYEYKTEAFSSFETMLDEVRDRAVGVLGRFEPPSPHPVSDGMSVVFDVRSFDSADLAALQDAAAFPPPESFGFPEGSAAGSALDSSPDGSFADSSAQYVQCARNTEDADETAFVSLEVDNPEGKKGEAA